VLIKVKVHPCLDLNFAGSRQKKTASGGNGQIYGVGGAFQGHRDAHIHLPAAVQLPAVQIPQPALQKEEEDMPLVESTSESENEEFKNALDRTIFQNSNNDKTPPTCTPPT
jgi:hypothetical protein